MYYFPNFLHLHLHLTNTAALSMIKSHGYAWIKLCLISLTPQYPSTGAGRARPAIQRMTEPPYPVPNLAVNLVFKYINIIIIIISFVYYIKEKFSTCWIFSKFQVSWHSLVSFILRLHDRLTSEISFPSLLSLYYFCR